MKKTKRILLIMSMLTIIISAFSVVNAETYGDFTYTVSENEVTITDCDTSVISVTIPPEIDGYPVTAIGEYAFEECYRLKDLTINHNLETIGDFAFAWCDGLENVSMANTVKTLGQSAFDGCRSLTTINLPDSITNIGEDAFSGCENLKNITLPAFITTIEPHTFAGCGFESFIIPDNIVTIGNGAFDSCTNLKSVTIGTGVKTIERYAFTYCTSLKDVYYNGTKQEWENIEISTGNDGNKYLLNAKKHFTDGDEPEKEDATLTINYPTLNLAVGKSSTLKATRTPADKTDVISWYSDDESIATVSSKGAVKAKSAGTTTIYAVTESGLETSCELRVYSPIKTLKLSTTKASMVVDGNDLELSVTATPYDHTDSISWLSSDENIVTVENGIVTAHNKGKAKITVISGSGKKATCTITVGVPADAVEFTALKSTSLAVGKTLTLKAKAFRLDGDKPVSTNVRYEIVDDEGIVTLDAKGKLKAIETGIVTVRAYPEACLDDEIYDEVTINVCIPATKVVLNYKSYSMVVDDTLDLDATLSPENHSDTHTWSVDKPDIATVDQDGVVTALKAGKVKITATTGSGKKATCSIKIGAPADTVKFSTLKTTSLAVGKTLTVTAKASCEDGSNPVSTAVVYEIVEGKNIATIDSKGKIKATGTGEVVIRATAQAGTETAYEEITISICNPITSIKFANSSISIFTNALTTNIFPTVSPANHTDTIKFTSSNTSVAIIDDFGNLTPVSKGTAKITATSGSGKKATCTVKVESPYITLSEITLHDVSYTYVEGDSIVDHNPGAVGGMNIQATAVAPSNLFEVRIAMWDTDISRMSLKEIQETAEWYADMWKETWETPSYTIDFPLVINTTHPVDADEVGKDLQVLLIGLDKNCNAVGYYILENDGYVEGGNDDDDNNNDDDSLDMIISESNITANGKRITAYMVVDGLKQSYLSNKTETPNDHIEYEWSIEFSDGTNNYGVGITHWKNRNADENIYMTLHDMQCDLWYNENPYSSSVIFTDVNLTIQGNRITFEFTIPDDYDFDSSKLTQGRTIATYYLY